MLRIVLKPIAAAGGGLTFLILAVAIFFYFTRSDGSPQPSLTVTSCDVGRYDARHRWYHTSEIKAEPGTQLVAKVAFVNNSSKDIYYDMGKIGATYGPQVIVHVGAAEYTALFGGDAVLDYPPRATAVRYVQVGHTGAPDFLSAPVPFCRAEFHQ